MLHWSHYHYKYMTDVRNLGKNFCMYVYGLTCALKKELVKQKQTNLEELWYNKHIHLVSDPDSWHRVYKPLEFSDRYIFCCS